MSHDDPDSGDVSLDFPADHFRGQPFDLRATLEGIIRRLDATIEVQNQRLGSVEADVTGLNRAHQQREGASRLTAKMIAALGGVMVAGFLGLFAYLWNGNAAQTRRDGAIERIDERQMEHSKLPGHSALSATDRRVDGVARSQVILRRDVDRNAVSIENNESEIMKVRVRVNRANRFRRGD